MTNLIHPYTSYLFFKKLPGGVLSLIFMLSLLILTACKTEEKKDQETKDSAIKVVRQAAEYEEQKAIWLLWPPADHISARSNDSVTTKLVREIAKYEKVIITANTDSLIKVAENTLKNNSINLKNIQLLTLPSEEIWIRDMGPNFVELANGSTGIVDFDFNAWGYGDGDDPYTKRMEAYDRAVAEHLGLSVIKSNMISEGGNRELNSEGILMLTEAVTLDRNPDLPKEVIEEEFMRVLGAKKIIWLAEGLLEDQHSFLGPIAIGEEEKAYTVVTTNGHIDEYARFVNDSTIVLADVPDEDLEDPLGKENKVRMEKNFEILSKATDLSDSSFNIVRLPLPKPVITTMNPGDPVYDYLSELDYKDGSTFPAGEPIKTIAAASYLNFIITNNLIIAQKYGKDDPENPNFQRDQKAKEILEGLFPDRKVIQVDALSINLGGGGLHCISIHQPKY